MYDCIELNNEMVFLANNISDMKKACTLTELWSMYQIAQKRLERIYSQNHERIMLINSVIQEPKIIEWECPYCFEHIKVYDNNCPDNCLGCGHKVRKEDAQ